MAAKYLRCSVHAAMKLPDEDIDNAYTAAVGNNIWRNWLIKNPPKDE